ncbi:hypothetical protein [Bosea sp. Root381]|uniref:hypothetical protein n=1 Tax=Bosea sp. Root381 TaxID=1736524 RepID=UPI0012E35B79|nr:hypothetical protein [Bosea sp. Root381]
MRAAIVPFEEVESRSTYVDSAKAWRFILRDSVRDLAGVTDVIGDLRAAALLIQGGLSSRMPQLGPATTAARPTRFERVSFVTLALRPLAKSRIAEAPMIGYPPSTVCARSSAG